MFGIQRYDNIDCSGEGWKDCSEPEELGEDGCNEGSRSDSEVDQEELEAALYSQIYFEPNPLTKPSGENITILVDEDCKGTSSHPSVKSLPEFSTKVSQLPKNGPHKNKKTVLDEEQDQHTSYSSVFHKTRQNQDNSAPISVNKKTIKANKSRSGTDKLLHVQGYESNDSSENVLFILDPKVKSTALSKLLVRSEFPGGGNPAKRAKVEILSEQSDTSDIEILDTSVVEISEDNEQITNIKSSVNQIHSFSDVIEISDTESSSIKQESGYLTCSTPLFPAKKSLYKIPHPVLHADESAILPYRHQRGKSFESGTWHPHISDTYTLASGKIKQDTSDVNPVSDGVKDIECLTLTQVCDENKVFNPKLHHNVIEISSQDESVVCIGSSTPLSDHGNEKISSSQRVPKSETVSDERHVDSVRRSAVLLCVSESDSESSDADSDDSNSSDSSIVSEEDTPDLNIHIEKSQSSYVLDCDDLEDLVDVTLDDVHQSLGECDWNVIPKDNVKVSRSFNKRYYTPFDVTCKNCRTKGHLSKLCPKPRKYKPCLFCGEEDHMYKGCPADVCFICEVADHPTRFCRLSEHDANFECFRCSSYGHRKCVCPDLWRQYHLTTADGPLVKGSRKDKENRHVFCYNCGQKGHFGHDCNKRRMGHKEPKVPFIFRYYVPKEIESDGKDRRRGMKRKFTGNEDYKPTQKRAKRDCVHGYQGKTIQGKNTKSHSLNSYASNMAMKTCRSNRREIDRRKLSETISGDYPRGGKRTKYKNLDYADETGPNNEWWKGESAVNPGTTAKQKKKARWKKGRKQLCETDNNLHLSAKSKKKKKKQKKKNENQANLCAYNSNKCLGDNKQSKKGNKGLKKGNKKETLSKHAKDSTYSESFHHTRQRNKQGTTGPGPHSQSSQTGQDSFHSVRGFRYTPAHFNGKERKKGDKWN